MRSSGTHLNCGDGSLGSGGKECGRFGRSIGDAIELGIVFAERLGDFHFLAGEQVDQLKRVDHAFRFVMIVGDDESFLAVPRDVFRALRPRFEFSFRIEIVIALVAGRFGIVAEPRVVAAAVQANVADGSRGAFGGASERPITGWSMLQNPTPRSWSIS